MEMKCEKYYASLVQQGQRRARVHLEASLIKELKENKESDFSQWKDDVKAALKDQDEPIALDMSGKLMSFDRFPILLTSQLLDKVNKISHYSALVHSIKYEVQSTAYKVLSTSGRKTSTSP